MLVPPGLNTRDRKEHDLNDLRVYYMICEEIGIADDENVQRSFQCLMGWAGDFKFIEEFTIFRRYIDKKRSEYHK